jgi:hypothetical protein
MPDDTVNALNEIAALLRRRVEQTDDATKRSMEHLASIKIINPMERPEYVKQLDENNARMARSIGDVEQRMAEERAFQARLLETLGRQNELLETLITRLKP